MSLASLSAPPHRSNYKRSQETIEALKGLFPKTALVKLGPHSGKEAKAPDLTVTFFAGGSAIELEVKTWSKDRQTPRRTVSGVRPLYYRTLVIRNPREDGDSWYVNVAVDASGTFSETKRQVGLLRMLHAGVIVSDYATLMVEILKDNARPEASEVYGAMDMPWAKLVGQIAQAYGK